MKKLLLSTAVAVGLFVAVAQPITTPQPSPTQTIKQNFGIGSIELSYSRPGVKGRKVIGDVVPFGKVWRTGANAATTLTFSDDVTIGGKEIKAGKYGLLSIPNETEWTLIITKDVNVNSPAAYKPENDVVRLNAKALKMGDKMETFTMQFANITGSTCELHLMWENTAVALPISTATDKKVLAQIDEVMNNDNRPYFAAASYYFDNGKDLTKAREWIDKALSEPANAKAYWMTLLKARIHEKMGDKAGAKSFAEKTVMLATEGKNDDYVKLGNDLIKKL